MSNASIQFGVAAAKLAYQVSIDSFWITNLSHIGVPKRHNNCPTSEHPKKGADGDDITSWVMFEDIYQPDSSKESSPTNSWGSPSWPSKAQTSPWVSCCLAYDVERLRLLLQVRKKRSGGRHKTWGYGHGIMGK